MYLFTRQTRLAPGAGPAGLEWAVEITGAVNEIGGHGVDLWANVFSPGFGTFSWTSWFEDLVTLEALGDKLQADERYQALITKGAELTDGGTDDGLIQLVHGEPDPSRELQYAGTVQAVCAAGGIAAAMGLGVAIADRAAEVTGLPTLFARGMTGHYGSVGWMTGYESIGQYQEAQDAIAGDTALMELVDSSPGVFTEDPSVTQATLLRKLA